MKKNRYILSILAVLSVIMLYVTPAPAESLRTEGVSAGSVAGTFTLILYGGRHFRDVESLAILDLEGDQYTFEPYAPDFDFRKIKGLSAKDALDNAQVFLSSHYAFRRSVLSRILDGSGKTVGYEVRPFYDPLTFGVTDVLDVEYVPRSDGKVRVYIRLKQAVERQLFSGGVRDGGRD